MSLFTKIFIGRKRRLSLYGLILLEVVAITFIFPSSQSTGEIPVTHDTTSLGVWRNFPTASACSSGNTTVIACELMGNVSYRGVMPNNPTYGSIPGISVNLSVGCIAPSNTVGAFLQAQYANYSISTHTNVSTFVNLPVAQNGSQAGKVFIDNSGNYPCPGNPTGFWSSVSLPTGNGYIFRVVGIGGGGLGDNPRFSSVNVHIEQLFTRLPTFIARVVTTTSFTAQVYVPIPSTTIMSATFNWQATNSTSYHQFGSGSCSIPINTFACTVSGITYPVAFTTTPEIFGNAYSPILNTVIPIEILPLLSAQTLTV